MYCINLQRCRDQMALMIFSNDLGSLEANGLRSRLRLASIFIDADKRIGILFLIQVAKRVVNASVNRLCKNES